MPESTSANRDLSALTTPRRLGFPILDSLPLVQDDQVPVDLLDRQNVSQHLFVIADCEEAVVAVLTASLGNGAGDELHGAVAEAVNFVPPLRLERRRTDDEHLADAGFSRQQLGDADTLYRLAKPHVVGQDGPAGADGKRDAVELIRQQWHL